MAGMAGFEPTHTGVKVLCLTAWRHPRAFGKKSCIKKEKWGEGRDSNPRSSEPQSDALANYATPTIFIFLRREPLPVYRHGTPGGIRTPHLLLRRQLLYPNELLAHGMERVTGIEPASPAWKAGALPLCYTRRTTDVQISLKIIAWGMYSVKTIFGNLR